MKTSFLIFFLDLDRWYLSHNREINLLQQLKMQVQEKESDNYA